MSHIRDPALDDLSVLNDPNWTPPSAHDIADWSRSAIRIIGLSDTLGGDLNAALAESQRVRSQVLLARSGAEARLNREERATDAALSQLPGTLEQYDAQRKKERQQRIAEMKTRKLLVADGFLDPATAQEVLHDDEALVEIGSQRLQQLLAPMPEHEELVSPNDASLSRLSSSTSLPNISPNRRSPLSSPLAGGATGISASAGGSGGEGGGEQDSTSTDGRGARGDAGPTGGTAAGPPLPRRKKNHRVRRKKKRTGGKRGSKRQQGESEEYSASMLSPKPERVPTVAENLDASARVLAIMEAERHRQLFRDETLAALKGQGKAKEHVEMERIFAREKAQAEKMIQQMLSEYKPRPVARKKLSGPKKGGSSRRRSSSAAGGGGSGLRDVMMKTSGGPRTNFKTTNLMPGSTLEVAPVAIPDGLDISTLELADETTMPTDMEPSVRDLLKSNTHEMDLSFPEVEKYKRPGQEFAKWKEKQFYG